MARTNGGEILRSSLHSRQLASNLGELFKFPLLPEPRVLGQHRRSHRQHEEQSFTDLSIGTSFRPPAVPADLVPPEFQPEYPAPDGLGQDQCCRYRRRCAIECLRCFLVGQRETGCGPTCRFSSKRELSPANTRGGSSPLLAAQ